MSTTIPPHRLAKHHPYYYKFLMRQANCTFTGPYSNWVWNVSGAWMEIPKHHRLRACRVGFHAMTPTAILSWANREPQRTLWRVEVDGDCIWKEYGRVIVARRMRIVSRVKSWDNKLFKHPYSERLLKALIEELKE